MENLTISIRNIICCFNDNQGFFSFLLSLLAVILAIAVPSRIAKKQNKIALIKQRYELYSILLFLSRFANAGDKLGFANKARWDLNHRAKHYLMIWLCEAGDVSIRHPQLSVNFHAIRQNGTWYGWEMQPGNGYSLNEVKIAFLHACSTQNSILEERKLLFDKKTRELLDQIQSTYYKLYTGIAMTADFSEQTQKEYETEEIDGVFDRLDSIKGGLEDSRRAFQAVVSQADEKGLFKTVKKLSTF